MAGNTFQDLFQGQMDYIFFFKGLAFILVLAVTCMFRGDTSQRLPWRWFGLFALMQGLAAWLSLVAMNFGEAYSLKIVSYVLQIISWVFLAEFGRSGIAGVQGRESGLWLIALLLMLTGLGGLKGLSGIVQASRYTLGLAGGLWAAVALFMAGRHLPARERGGSLTAGISLVLFSITVALFPPLSLASPDSLLSQASFQRLTGLPLNFIQALLAFGMAAGSYGFLPWRQQRESQESKRRSRSIFVLLTTLSIILGLGSVLTLYLGEWAQKNQEKTKAEAQEYASIVVSRLNTEFKRMEDGVTAMAETSGLANTLRYQTDDNLEKANTVLDRYRSALEASVCYLMDKSGKTIASSNRQDPDSFVGKNYGFRPYFKQANDGNTGRYFAVGVTSKVPGYYVSRPVRANLRGKAVQGVAVIKVSLKNVTQELQAAGQKGNSIICLADPRGVVFLGSHPEMLLKSLWPVAEKDQPDLKEQYGKDQFPAIFPQKIVDGSKITYQGHHYMASFAGTIHAGWSVFFFRPVEMVGAYRLTGIAVACILAILALLILGSNFYFKERALASVGRFQAMFDAAPEAIGVIDPDTLKIIEANQSLATLLGYPQKDLLGLNLTKLLNQDAQEIRNQLLNITRTDETARIEWQARRGNGRVLDLEVIGSKLEQQGRDQVLVFCREAEALPASPAAIFPESGQFPPVQEPQGPSLLTGSNFKDPHDAIKNILPHLAKNKPDGNGDNLEAEASLLIKRIRNALNKAEKLRKTSENL